MREDGREKSGSTDEVRVESPWLPELEAAGPTAKTPVELAVLRPSADAEAPAARTLNFRGIVAPLLGLIAGFLFGKAPSSVAIPSGQTAGESQPTDVPGSAAYPKLDTEELQTGRILAPGKHLVVNLVAPLLCNVEEFNRACESAVGVVHNAGADIADSFSVNELRGSIKRYAWGVQYAFFITPERTDTAPHPVPKPIIDFATSVGKEIFVSVAAERVLKEAKKLVDRYRGVSQSPVTASEPVAPVGSASVPSPPPESGPPTQLTVRVVHAWIIIA